MAIRKIRVEGDPILRKTSKKVKKITKSTKTLLDDMKETMYLEEGIGLAAPQVGALRRVFIVDVGDNGIVEFINPEIIETDGEQVGIEGCLSVPGMSGNVCRPFSITVKALDRDGKEFTMEVEELLARAILHEYDHLEGRLFIDIAEDEVTEEEVTEEEVTEDEEQLDETTDI